MKLDDWRKSIQTICHFLERFCETIAASSRHARIISDCIKTYQYNISTKYCIEGSNKNYQKKCITEKESCCSIYEKKSRQKWKKITHREEFSSETFYFLFIVSKKHTNKTPSTFKLCHLLLHTHRTCLTTHIRLNHIRIEVCHNLAQKCEHGNTMYW